MVKVDLDALLERGQALRTLRDDGFADTVVTGSLPPEVMPTRVSLKSPGGAEVDTELALDPELGRGGMGRVLLASQQSLGREVAVKVLRYPGAETAALLEQEAKLTGTLEHPGIIPVHALGSDEAGWPVLVMTRVVGVAWSELLADPGAPAWAKVAPGGDHLEANIRILQQVCNAIAFAHRKGVLHRDLKPANVLVGDYGEVYVADWGIAVRREAASTATLVGTPAYLAPEMTHGEPGQLSERTDVFLLGATLYEVLAGRPPWQGATLRELMGQAAQGVAPPLPAEVSGELRDICRTAMAKDPKLRFATALELRDALEVALHHRGSVAIAEATQRRLGALAQAFAGGASALAIAALISECRFGFAQALRDWPQNPLARAGVLRSLELAIELELREGHAAPARALALEHGSVPAELEARIAELEVQDAASRVRAQQLEALARGLDPRVARWPRIPFVVGLMVLIAALGVSRVLAPAWWARPATPLLVSVLFGGSFMLALLAFRRVFLTTTLNRKLATFVCLMLFGQVVNRAHALVVGLALEPTLARELGMLGLLILGASIAFHWSFMPGAAVAFGGALLFTVNPSLTTPWFSLVIMVMLLVTVLLPWRAWKAKLPQVSPDRASG